ncbi:hypothetical protein AB0J14_38605 [Micromonospora arborensis]|uniref:hypothetical protein n=1 Tax=Micromonospora arborensis TaxID=2116518 RepID=UPI0033C63B13
MNGTDRARIGAVTAAKAIIARQDAAAAVAPIRATGFENFRVALTTATAEELAATVADWDGRTGFSAAMHRNLITHEVEFRQAVQHDIDTAYAALVAEMAPPTRWEAQK